MIEKETSNATVGNVQAETALLSGSDTVAGSISTTQTLAVGSSVTGFINSSSDEDYFAIDLVAGTTYQFTLNGSGSSELTDPTLYLTNSAGTRIELNDDGGPGLDSLLSFTADSTGTYYLVADGYDTKTGQYTLDAQAVHFGRPVHSLRLKKGR